MKKDRSHIDNRYKALFMPEWFSDEPDRGYLSSIPHILDELYVEGVYDPYFVGLHDITALDLGAHIGMWSMYASRFCKKIYAVEPSSNLCKIMRKNFDWNGFKNIEIVQAAVTNKDNEVNLYEGMQNSSANLLHDNPAHKSEKVQGWTLETLFNNLKLDWVDFVKMDIEGAEFGVISGDYFDKVKDKIGMIMGEMHKWANRNYDQLKWALNKRGFEVEFPTHKADLFIARRAK